MNNLLTDMTILKKPKKEAKQKIAQKVAAALKGLNKGLRSKKLEKKIKKVSSELADLIVKEGKRSKKKPIPAKKKSTAKTQSENSVKEN